MNALDLALEAHAAGRPAEAMDHLRRLDAVSAQEPKALQLWAMLLPPERRAEALAMLEQAVRIAPGQAQAHFNLAVRLQSFEQLDRAVLHYQQCLSLDPKHTGALNNLSDLYRRRGRSAEGWRLGQRYLMSGGQPAGVALRLAKLALDSRDLDNAQVWFDAAVAAKPGDPQTLWEDAMLSLLRGDWRRGWSGYQARLAYHGPRDLGIYPHTAPAWTGQAVAGRRLLLHREQGLGDMIMFASAVPGLIAEGAEVHLAVPPALVRLFAESFPAARVWSSITAIGAPAQPPQPYLDAIGPIDLQAPMGSLGALRMSDGPPSPTAYITASPADVAMWADRLEALAPANAGERRIGLVIGAGRPGYSDDGMTNSRRKSIPADLVGALKAVPQARWFALHDRTSAAMLADIPDLPFVDLSPWLTDLADTAAAIACLDLVVTVDTAVAHLAGAMGKPVLLLLWFAADWRWGLGPVDSAFYRDVAILRQASAGDWAGVVQAAVSTLSRRGAGGF